MRIWKELTTEDQSIYRMQKALRNEMRKIPPLHEPNGMVYTDEGKADFLTNTIELTSRRRHRSRGKHGQDGAQSMEDGRNHGPFKTGTTKEIKK